MWLKPKTDWFGEVTDGVYHGDRFNAEDYNRIKNNLIELRRMAIEVWKSFEIGDLGEDKTPVEYFYADEINAMEDALKTINENTVKRDYGQNPLFMDNGATPDYRELNRLESAILDLYNRIYYTYSGRRKFVWNFGMKGDF